jgi:hypothetical protein
VFETPAAVETLTPNFSLPPFAFDYHAPRVEGVLHKPTRLRRSHGRLDGLAYAPRLRARLDVEQQLIDDAPPAAGHARSNVTKQPNDGWSSSSTTWPDAYCVCRYARDCRSQSVCTDMPR